MTLLSRYLLRQNLFLLLLICGVGLGMFLFIELFDRLDNFLEADVPASNIALYLLYRVPFALAQIFPAVFLLSLMAQLGLMLRNRELLALTACAVPMLQIVKIVLIYACILGCAQFFFSEILGVRGHRAAEKIWVEQVRNRQVTRLLSDVWFKEGNRILHMEEVSPAAGEGRGLTVFTLEEEDAGVLREILRAETFQEKGGGLQLRGVRQTTPTTLLSASVPEMHIPLRTSLGSFQVIDPKVKLESLPLWQLGREIRRLQDSGSNIERLLTAWHMKLAYAASVVIMALIALSVLTAFHSLYIILPLGLTVTFCYYGLFVLGVSAGEKGIVPPMTAAWAANAFFAALAGGWILWKRSFQLNRR